jgi:hypothetical protein
MKLGLNEKQLELILSQLPENQEISEEPTDPSAAQPSAGTSATQTGAQGYPEVGKWESDVTRGPGNQVGVTKWSDVVGASLKRGKANPLNEVEYTKESLLILIEQTSPFYDKTGKFFGGGPMSKPQGAIDANVVFPNIKNGKYPLSVSTDVMKNALSNLIKKGINEPWTSTNTQQSISVLAKYTPGYWKGKPQPKKPTPYKGQILSKPGTILPKEPWGYYEGKLGNLDIQNSTYESDVEKWTLENYPNEYYKSYRKTPGGVDEVPEGFSPLDYDEYITKRNVLLSQKKKSVNRLRQEIIDKQLVDLDKEYKNNDYPKGISKQEKKELDSWLKAIDDYYGPQIKSCNQKNKVDFYKSYLTATKDNTRVANNFPFGTGPCDDLKYQYRTKRRDMMSYYGYHRDTRNDFDKWWDQYGIWVQVGGTLLLTILVPAVGGTAATALLADAGLNVAIAGYEASRGKYADAGVSLLIAALPFYGPQFGVPTKIAESLSLKLASAEIKTSADLAKFMLTLGEDESKWLKYLLEQKPELLEKMGKEVCERALTKMESNGVKVTNGMKEKLKQNWLDKGIKKSQKIIKKPNIIKRPMVKKFVVDGVLITSAKTFGDVMEKKYELNLEENERKRLESFFNAIPVEVQNLYLQYIGKNQVLELKDGQYEPVLNQITKNILEESNRNANINPKTNKPYTESEIKETNRQILEILKKEMDK